MWSGFFAQKRVAIIRAGRRGKSTEIYEKTIIIQRSKKSYDFSGNARGVGFGPFQTAKKAEKTLKNNQNITKTLINGKTLYKIKNDLLL